MLDGETEGVRFLKTLPGVNDLVVIEALLIVPAVAGNSGDIDGFERLLVVRGPGSQPQVS